MGDQGHSGTPRTSQDPKVIEMETQRPNGELCGKSQPRSEAHISDESGHLRGLLEKEIIPRLMLAHRVSGEPSAQHDTPHVRTDEVSELTRLLALEDPRFAQSFVSGVVARGVSIESVFLDLFAPAAKLIGEFWEKDLCTFTDVTIVLSRLHQLVRTLSAACATNQPWQIVQQVAVLTPAPGEQHVFGLTLLEEFLRRAGWEVVPEISSNVVESVRNRFVTMVGFTASDEDRIEGLTELISEVRLASLNRELVVMVGGRCFNESPELVGRVGADATAHDAREAVLAMQPRLETMVATNALAGDGTRQWTRPTTRCNSPPRRSPSATSTRG